MLGILIRMKHLFTLFLIFLFMFFLLYFFFFCFWLGHIGYPLLEGFSSLKKLRSLKVNLISEREAGTKVYKLDLVCVCKRAYKFP